jgi:enoyl-CoA hydratase/carnithine racemase
VQDHGKRTNTEQHTPEMPMSLSVNPDTDDLKVTQDGHVVTVTIDREAEANRLTPDALAKLERLAADWREAGDVRVIVITGAGAQVFSTGILNPVLRAAFSKDDIIALVRLANRAYDAIEALPQIVIAALNGPARAGAAELALACDIRIAAAHASMMFPEAAWGGFPGAGGPQRLAATVGRGRALELICTGREADAAEMERIGLTQATCPSAELAGAARALASRIAEAGPLATFGAKRIIRARAEPGLAAARELSDALRHELEWSHDVDEGIAAHRENRKPRFTGR